MIFILFLSFFIYGKLLIPMLGDFISNYFEKYDRFMLQEGKFGSGFGFAYYSLLLLLTLHIGKFQKDETVFIFNLSILFFFILPIGLIINMALRLIYYFQPTILASFPVIINNIKFKPVKIVIALLIIAFSLRGYYSFLNSEVWHDAYLTYRTIFFVN